MHVYLYTYIHMEFYERNRIYLGYFSLCSNYKAKWVNALEKEEKNHISKRREIFEICSNWDLKWLLDIFLSQETVNVIPYFCLVFPQSRA